MTAICHITSVHPSDDPRIFHKECVSLAKAGYDVTLVAPGGSRKEAGVTVIGCGEVPTSRIERALTYARHVVDVALSVPAEIVHLHDPELLLQVSRLRRAGRKVIFDSHEDYGVKKAYLSGMTAEVVRRTTLLVERHAGKKLSGLICCYDKTRERLAPYVDAVAMIYNFPIVEEVEETEPLTPVESPFVIGYAGGIKPMWHLDTLLKAVEPLEGVSVRMAGIPEEGYLEELRKSAGWQRVAYKGRLPFSNVQDEIYAPAQLGVALLDYIPAYNDKEGSLSNTKLFEVMEAGLPIVATDFRVWREVIEGNHCGICVDPRDPHAVREAIEQLRDHPERAREMGQNARRAVRTQYNWAQEERKLLALYRQVLEGNVKDVS